MRSQIDNLQENAKLLSAELTKLERFSSARDRGLNKPGDQVVVITTSTHAWNKLASEGAEIQRKLIKESERFAAIARTLVAARPSKAKSELERELTKIRSVVHQESGLSGAGVAVPFDAARIALTTLIAGLREAYSASPGNEVILVPDTNALLYNPAIEQWRFDTLTKIRIVFVPQVLSELDEQKVRGNPSIKEKAERVIRQYKEYRRRGSMVDGVSLSNGYSTVAAVAVEPKAADNLPWLDLTAEDDRILASVVELTRDHATTVVALVTRDSNLQNKADFAGVPLVEPPSPEPVSA